MRLKLDIEKLAVLAVVVVAVMMVFPAYAPPPNDPEPIPIDGGATALLGAGIYLGYRKLRKSKANRENK